MATKETKDLVKIEPARYLSPFEALEKRFEDFIRQPFAMLGPSWWPSLKMPEEVSPVIDIFEEGNDIVVKAELPGMKKDDIEVRLSDGAITISGEKRKEETIEKKDYYRFERSFGAFSRAFSLPLEVQVDKAKAQFKDGILEVRIPKSEEAIKKEKKVKIE